MEAVTLGPFVLGTERLFLLAAIGVAFATVRWFPRGERHAVERSLGWMLIAGALTARAAYVLTHADAFIAHPLTILAFWDGGFVASAGAIVAVVVAIERARRRGFPLTRLLAPMLAATITWIAGAALAHLPSAASRLPLPVDTRLEDLAGNPVDIHRFIGRPTIVNLWATWCPPCRAEMPMLGAAQAARPDLNFVFVNQGEPASAISSYLADQRLDMRNVVTDPAHAFEPFTAYGLPTTLFFGADGHQVSRHVGALTPARLRDYLEDVARARPAVTASRSAEAPRSR